MPPEIGIFGSSAFWSLATVGAGMRNTPSLSAPSMSSNCFQCATSEISPIVFAASPRMKPSYSSMNLAVELAPSGNQPAALASTQLCRIAFTSGLDHFSLPAAKAACCSAVQASAASAENQNSMPKPSLLPSAKQGTAPLALIASQALVSSAQLSGGLAGSSPASA